MGALSNNLHLHMSAEGGALSETFDPKVNFVFLGIRVHIDIAPLVPSDIEVQLDSKSGPLFDTVFFADNLQGDTDVVFMADTPIPVQKDDKLIFAYANPSARDIGVEFIYRKES